MKKNINTDQKSSNFEKIQSISLTEEMNVEKSSGISMELHGAHREVSMEPPWSSFRVPLHLFLFLTYT